MCSLREKLTPTPGSSVCPSPIPLLRASSVGRGSKDGSWVGPEASKAAPVILKGVSRSSASDRNFKRPLWPQLHASSECPRPGGQDPLTQEAQRPQGWRRAPRIGFGGQLAKEQGRGEAEPWEEKEGLESFGDSV